MTCKWSGMRSRRVAGRSGSVVNSLASGRASRERVGTMQMLGEEEMTPWQADTKDWRAARSKA